MKYIDELVFYVYKVTDPTTGEFYIGSRQCKCTADRDTYMGSMCKWRPDKKKLIKEILKSDFKDRSSAFIYEREQIEIHYNNPLNRNYSRPTENFYSYFPGEKNPFFGKKHTAAARAIMQAKAINRSYGENNNMHGKTHRDSSKKLMHDKKIGLYNGKNNPRARKIYQYNTELQLIAIWNCGTEFLLNCKRNNLIFSKSHLSQVASYNSSSIDSKKIVHGFILSFNELVK